MSLPDWSSGADQRLLRVPGRSLGRTGGEVRTTGREGGAGGGGILSAVSVQVSTPTSERCTWLPECANCRVGVGVSARHTSPVLSWRQCRPYSWALRWGLHEDQPWSRTKNGYSAKTVSSSCRKKDVQLCIFSILPKTRALINYIQ